MTASANPRQEILELAQLEMLCALDQVELGRLERMRRAASPALIDEVIQLQAEVAADESLLPNVTPSASLKFMVMAAVGDEIAARDASLAPLASIGSSGSSRNAGAASARGLVRESVPSAVADFDIRRDALRWRRSSAIWRAACLALAGGLVTAIFSFAQLQRESGKVVSAFASNRIDASMSEAFPDLPEFLARGPNIVVADKTAAGGSGELVLLFDPLKNQVMAIGFGGNSGDVVDIIFDPNKSPVRVGSLTFNGRSCSAIFDVSDLPAGALSEFEAQKAGIGEVMFESPVQ